MPAIVLLLTAADPSPALANACSPGARRGVPVRVPRGPADLAMLPEACGAMEATFYLRGTLALALDDFYGSIEGALGVRGRLALSRRLWISFSVPALEARFAANATVEDARFDFGATSLAAHYGFDVGSRLRVAPYFRLLIPTETSFASGTRFGYELGVSGVARLARRLELVGGVLAASSFVVIGDRQTSVVTLGVVADWVWHAARWLTVAGGVAVRAVPGDTRLGDSVGERRDGLEAVEVRVEPRLWLGRWSVGLGAELPVVGRDRTNGRVAVTVGRGI